MISLTGLPANFAGRPEVDGWSEACGHDSGNEEPPERYSGLGIFIDSFEIRWNNCAFMNFITIPVLFLASVWTVLLFLAYSDWDLFFKGSLPAWVVCAAVWGITRLIFWGSHNRSRASEKTDIWNRIRLPLAGAAVALSLAIFIFAVWDRKWLDRGNRSVGDISAVDLGSTSKRVSGSESQKLLTKKQPDKSRRAEAILRYPNELWAVQVGAFRSEQDALKLATTLKNKGYEAYVIRREVEALTLYKAKVGRFATRDEAERLLRVLKDKEAYTTAFVAKM